MQSHAGLDSMNHLGADCGVVDVCTDVDAGEDGHDVKCESVTHSIYHQIVNPRGKKQEGRQQVPMNRSGTSFETASHARYIDPRLCPSRVNMGHVVSSTRYLELRKTKCSDSGESSMSNLD